MGWKSMYCKGFLPHYEGIGQYPRLESGFMISCNECSAVCLLRVYSWLNWKILDQWHLSTLGGLVMNTQLSLWVSVISALCRNCVSVLHRHHVDN